MKVIGYLIKMRGLMNLKRYQNLFLFKQRSVAEHSWSVSRIAHSLALIEIHKFGKEVNIASLLQKTLMHDDLEVITGDILSHTKRRTPAMKRAVATLEKKVFSEEYANIIPAEWKDEFKEFTLDAKDDTLEGHLLHASDVIDTLFEALEEIKLGNREYFVDVLQNSLQKLFVMEIDSVQYFLNQFIDSFEEMKFNYRKHFEPEFMETLDKWKSGESIVIQQEEGLNEEEGF
jgi:5'-deoxynucleotidase YfbR-like HD superfamily hydrolase